MGLILDTSLTIRAERDGLSVTEALLRWSAQFQGEELGISVITLAELAHGIPRARNDQRRAERVQFIEGLRRGIPVFTINEEISLRAGEIDGELASAGATIGLADALIAATALVRSDGIATHNLRHFRLIPGLNVVEVL